MCYRGSQANDCYRLFFQRFFSQHLFLPQNDQSGDADAHNDQTDDQETVRRRGQRHPAGIHVHAVDTEMIVGIAMTMVMQVRYFITLFSRLLITEDRSSRVPLMISR